MMNDAGTLNMAHQLLRRTPVCIICVLLTGCSGYRVGSTLPEHIKSVAIPTFVNKCGEPDVEAVATSETIREFQRDGTLRVVDMNEADTVLEVRLTGYRLVALRFSRDRVTEAQEYRLVLTADVVLKERSTGKKLVVNSGVSGKSTFELLGDLATAKQAALPQCARNLAHNIVESAVEAW